jgi:hypothetical protein
MEESMTFKKFSARNQLWSIEDALVEAILASSESELREDIEARSDDPAKRLANINLVITRAKAVSAKMRFERIKLELANWRASEPAVVTFNHQIMRARLEKIIKRDPEFAAKVSMAARKGAGLPDTDMEGLLEDLAKLERLEGEESGE